MKQVELAKQLGISKSYLSMILSGQRKPNTEVARIIISSQKVHNIEAGSSLRGRCPKPLDECAAYNTATRLSGKFITGLPKKFITSRRRATSVRSIGAYHYTRDDYNSRNTVKPVSMTRIRKRLLPTVRQRPLTSKSSNITIAY